MYQTPEQLIALNKANLEAALRFAGVALEGTERLIDLQLKTAKSVLADGMQNARALASVRDFEQLAALKDTVVQPTFEKATAYAKQVLRRRHRDPGGSRTSSSKSRSRNSTNRSSPRSTSSSRPRPPGPKSASPP